MRLIPLLLCLLLCACATHPGPVGAGTPGTRSGAMAAPQSGGGFAAVGAAESEDRELACPDESGNGTRSDNATEAGLGGEPSPGGFEKFLRETGKVLVTIVGFSVGVALMIVTHAPVL